jgi:uncharacterized membrane protein YfcA
MARPRQGELMKRGAIGPFVWTCLLTIFVAVLLIDVRDLPPEVRIVPTLVGTATMVILVVLLIGAFRPEILSWTESTMEDLWGGGQRKQRPPDTAEEQPPWSAVLLMMGYAIGFLVAMGLFGYVVVPPFFIVLFLVREARVGVLRAIVVALVTTAGVYGGMRFLQVDIWAGAIPEIIPGILGGAVLPPL